MDQMKLPIAKSLTSQERDAAKKTIRLAVSGDVILTSLEVKIIDSIEFQRLRWLKQLGTSYLIYPSAQHTRFEHSLGVLKMTETMMNNIVSNRYKYKKPGEDEILDDQKVIARLAALMHDVANIPFGHTLEDETKVISTYQEDEKRFSKYFTKDTEIGKILIENLQPDELKLLQRILTAKKDPSDEKHRDSRITYVSDLKGNAFIVDIIKNTVCADLLDYLMRDAYFCGLPLSIPDRFLSYLYIHEDKNGVRRVAIRVKEQDGQRKQALISELIQLLETRYFLAERVYFHHAKQISSAMIGAAVYDAITNFKEYTQDKSTAGGIMELTTDNLLSWGDKDLINELKKYPKNSPAHKIADDLDRRILYKPIFNMKRSDFVEDEEHLKFLEYTFHEDPRVRNENEKTLCETVGLDAGDIIIYFPSTEMNSKIAEMKVTAPEGGVEPFFKVADPLTKNKIDSILASHRELWRLQVFVKREKYEAMDANTKDTIRAICKTIFEDHRGAQGESDLRSCYRTIISYIADNQNVNMDQSLREEVLETFLVARKNAGNKKIDFVEIFNDVIKQRKTP